MAGLQWISNGYMLALASLVLLGGGIGDRIGTLRAFRVGLALFGLSSVTCGVAPSVSVLIAARIVQGAGAAVLVPTSLALVSQAYTGDARGKAIGTWSAAGGVLLAFGPPLGGWLVDHAGWRSIFSINVPIAVLAAALSVRIDLGRPTAGSRGLDYFGAALAVATLGLLTFGFIELGEGANLAGWGSIALALPIAAVFLVAEARSQNALFPCGCFAIEVFRERTYSRSFCTRA